jgi:hypothetical protein
VRACIEHDTLLFAVNAVRRWWKVMGRNRYSDPQDLLITAVHGSNGSRVRLWEVDLNKLADELDLPIAHLPPDASKAEQVQPSPLLVHRL